MKIYSMNISSINADNKKWYAALSDRRIEKVERLKQPLKKAQSIGAELLLKYAVNKETGENGIVNWDIDKNGKLFLPEHDGLYVNLSHSRNYSVCAVHDNHIGVDIQYCRECDMRMAERFFTTDEALFINSHANKNNAFFEVWTKKESFVKAVGKGLTIPLNSFSVLSDSIEYEGKQYKFKEYSVSDSGYKLFVCYLS